MSTVNVHHRSHTPLTLRVSDNLSHSTVSVRLFDNSGQTISTRTRMRYWVVKFRSHTRCRHVLKVDGVSCVLRQTLWEWVLSIFDDTNCLAYYLTQVYYLMIFRRMYLLCHDTSCRTHSKCEYTSSSSRLPLDTQSSPQHLGIPHLQRPPTLTRYRTRTSRATTLLSGIKRISIIWSFLTDFCYFPNPLIYLV